MTAPNPWRVDSDCLNPEYDFEAENVLDAIRINSRLVGTNCQVGG